MKNLISRSSIVLTALLLSYPLLAADHQVLVQDNSFSPGTLTIQAGDTVTWSNVGGGIHNVRADDDSFRCATSCSGSGGTPSPAAWSVTVRFDDPGENGYYCEVHGAPGGVGMSGVITVTGEEEPEIPDENFVVLLPVSGSVQGQSFFRTDARILNPSPTDTITIAASFLPIGANNTEAELVLETLGPRQARVFPDVVGSLLDRTGLGAVRLFSDGEFVVSSRIYTDSDCDSQPGGTFGQFVPGTPEQSAELFGIIPNLEATEEFRSNIGIVNTTLETSTIILHLIGPEGEISQTAVTLAPRSSIPPSALASLFGVSGLNEQNLFVTFEASHRAIAYGSVVDNITADQVFVPAVADPPRFAR